MKQLTSGLVLALLAALFLVFALLNNVMFGGWRLDLTEGQLYTLSDGSRDVVSQIDEPITLHFFFSEQASQDLTGLRAYATRVRELLEEYELAADGRLRLRIIDPEPFSEAEDQASEFGLQGVPVNTAGDELYFGLAGTNALDDVSVIPFFQPDKEEFLEYDISKLIHELSEPAKPVVGLISPLPVRGDVNMQTFESTPAWTSIAQLEQLNDVLPIDMSETTLPEGMDLLVVVHPKDISDALLYAIDQFVMGGGRLLAFVDPIAESDRPQASPMMPMPDPNRASDLNRLTSTWGVTLKEGTVLGDAQYALQVQSPDGSPTRHLAIVGLTPESLLADDVVTAQLETLNMGTAGIFTVEPTDGITAIQLISSSAYAMGLDALQFQFMSDPAELQQGFAPTGERYSLAVRLEGATQSAFPDGPPAGTEEDDLALPGEAAPVHIGATDNLNVILVADTDILTDRLWVQVQNFFGQRIATPWADNGDFVINAVENLAGGSDLIGIRSRGRYTRPFTVVQDLRREAEARYLENAQVLEAELEETERKLADLEAAKVEGGMLVLSPEQEAELDRFQAEKLRIRKQLRDVSHQLEKDIQSLGGVLKFINIFLMPLLLTLGLLAIRYVTSRRALS